MELECSIEDCVAVMSTKIASESSRKGQKDVFLRLKDSEGEVLSEIKVPWPDGEPEPCEVSYLDSEECLRLTNNATFAAVPLRISKIREVFRSRRPVAVPKRFPGFSNPPVSVDDANQIMFHSALKDFVKEPLADGKWKNVVKCLSLKDVDADGFLTRDEGAVILHFLPTQSLSSKELKCICEGLRKANVFGPSSLASFYELCLNLGQTSIVRSAIESSDALSEQCIAMFLNFVAGESEDTDDHLLSRLLTRRFDPRRMANAAARRVTTQNASVLMRKCMDIYVSPKHGDIAEQEVQESCITVEPNHEPLRLTTPLLYLLRHRYSADCAVSALLEMALL